MKSLPILAAVGLLLATSGCSFTIHGVTPEAEEVVRASEPACFARAVVSDERLVEPLRKIGLFREVRAIPPEGLGRNLDDVLSPDELWVRMDNEAPYRLVSDQLRFQLCFTIVLAPICAPLCFVEFDEEWPYEGKLRVMDRQGETVAEVQAQVTLRFSGASNFHYSTEFWQAQADAVNAAFPAQLVGRFSRSPDELAKVRRFALTLAGAQGPQASKPAQTKEPAQEPPSKPAPTPTRPEPTRPEPRPALRARGRTFVLIVGVDDYADQRLSDLRFAEADARAVYRFYAQDPASPTDSDRVQILTGKQATQRRVLRALSEHLLRKATRPEDTAIFYFAGHGLADPSGTYLACHDTEADGLEFSGLSLASLQQRWDRLGAQQRVLITDACRSGALAGLRGFSGVGARVEPSAAGGARSLVIAAACASQFSTEDARAGQGVFTGALLQGLRGRADANRDGLVAAAELKAYLEREVPSRARELGGNQTPVVALHEASDLALTAPIDPTRRPQPHVPRPEPRPEPARPRPSPSRTPRQEPQPQPKPQPKPQPSQPAARPSPKPSPQPARPAPSGKQKAYAGYFGEWELDLDYTRARYAHMKGSSRDLIERSLQQDAGGRLRIEAGGQATFVNLRRRTKSQKRYELAEQKGKPVLALPKQQTLVLWRNGKLELRVPLGAAHLSYFYKRVK